MCTGTSFAHTRGLISNTSSTKWKHAAVGVVAFVVGRVAGWLGGGGCGATWVRCSCWVAIMAVAGGLHPAGHGGADGRAVGWRCVGVPRVPVPVGGCVGCRYPVGVLVGSVVVFAACLVGVVGGPHN